MALTLTTGKTFANQEQVTPAKLNLAVNGATITGSVSIAEGGTGATTAEGARNALGLGTAATPTFAGLTLTGDLITALAARVSTDFSKSDTSLSAVTGLSLTLTAGATYGFQFVCFISCAAAGGFQFDLNASSATATALRVDALSIDQATVRSQVQATALSTLLYGTVGSAVSPIKLVVEGTITVNTGGTLAPRFAQYNSSGTASIVLAGSRAHAWRIA
jgi:hypothetical protein